MDAQLARRRFEEALEDHAPEFERFFLARLFATRISYDDEQEVCVVELPFADFTLNPQGTVHGGVIAFAMDVSMGHLCHRYLSTGVTLEMRVQFLRPVTSDSRAEGRFLKKGRSIAYLESRLLDAEDRLAAFATSTWKVDRQNRRTTGEVNRT